MSKDAEKSVLFVFQTDYNSNNSPIKIYFRGLNPDLKYKVDDLNEILSGTEWMSRELCFPLFSFTSVFLEINAYH